MFANSIMIGIDFAFPDVCKTPPVAVPIPYPNIGMNPIGAPPAFKVIVGGTPAHNMATTVFMTFGDEPGALGGVVSQIFKAHSRKVTGAFMTLFMGIPATRLTSTTIQNVVNAVGMTVVPSQIKVIVLK